MFFGWMHKDSGRLSVDGTQLDKTHATRVDIYKRACPGGLESIIELFLAFQKKILRKEKKTVTSYVDSPQHSMLLPQTSAYYAYADYYAYYSTTGMPR